MFVRVVDSCAGCAQGSKHVDLTQAAFKELADLDTGIMSVQMRQATDPDGWCVFTANYMSLTCPTKRIETGSRNYGDLNIEEHT